MSKVKNNVIDIHIKEVSRALSRFSCDENLILSSEFVKHFEETYLQTKMRGGGYKINLTTSDTPTTEEEEKLRQAFRDHYANEVEENNFQLGKYRRNAVIFFCISVLFFLIGGVLAQIEAHAVIQNIGMVASWAVTFKFIDSLTFFQIPTLINRKRNIWARDAQVNVIKKQAEAANNRNEY